MTHYCEHRKTLHKLILLDDFRCDGTAISSWTKYFAQTAHDRFVDLCLTFPHYINFPSRSLKIFNSSLVSRDVSTEFVLPKPDSRLGGRGLLTAWVTMPEASMYKHGHTVLWEYEIRCPREVAPMEPVA